MDLPGGHLDGRYILFTLLFHVVREGIAWLDLQFLDSFPSRKPEQAGIKSALWGSVWVMGLTAMISIPLSIASAIYLEEYAPKNKWMRIVEINLANLAAMPSILYGLLGLAILSVTLIWKAVCGREA